MNLSILPICFVKLQNCVQEIVLNDDKKMCNQVEQEVNKMDGQT